MKTSARNQFDGTVTGVKPGAVNDEVEITTPSGLKVVAVLTHESVVNLGLEPGKAAFALVKASSVIVVTDEAGARFSTRNRFSGTLTQVQQGAVNAEVVIDLPGGSRVAAIVTQESANRLGLVPGQPATALFKASSVIVGVPG
ncbi:TOBE domain-containing protein [Ottowia thiooxydans]|uniref:TOBE domain-containing protein n=1 Tax=Ottowia thiooxydans TaxID=219182 RepID=UPI000406DB85|nr:TOBE domain-containing protein [Ottowia thiooxydans]